MARLFFFLPPRQEDKKRIELFMTSLCQKCTLYMYRFYGKYKIVYEVISEISTVFKKKLPFFIESHANSSFSFSLSEKKTKQNSQLFITFKREKIKYLQFFSRIFNVCTVRFLRVSALNLMSHN